MCEFLGGGIIIALASTVGPGEEVGERPTLLQERVDCEDCGHAHEIEVCPKCGSFITPGYGLMFGGVGEYKFCNGDNGDCDWFWKREDSDG